MKGEEKMNEKQMVPGEGGPNYNRKTFWKLLAALLAAVVLLTATILPMAMSVAAGSSTGGTTASAASGSAAGGLKVMSLSDTHLLPSSMIKGTADYTTDLNSDRKMFTQSEAILDAQLKKVKEEKPDVLLISGDLTKDGELKSHKALAKKLKALKKQLPNLKVYVINGNHDINNSDGKDFNTSSGEAVAAAKTSPAAFKSVYKDVTYGDSSIIATFTPSSGKQAGQLSYAARPKKGYTVIAIDSGRYSSDNTSTGENEHETSGQISKELEAWVLKQIAAAKKRGDTVIGLEHHNLVPHFTMESTLLPMYLVNDYDRLSEEFADAGMHYIFTGHMHAQDVSKMTTAAGNDLYDFETGSSITYPSPIRVENFSRSVSGKTVTEKVTGRTIENLKITYRNAVTGKTETIGDVTAYGKQNGISAAMLKTTLGSALGSVSDRTKKTMNKVIDDLVKVPVTDSGSKNLLQFANYVYQEHLGGTDDGADPSWFKEARTQLKNGELLDKLVLVLAKDLGGTSYQTAEAVVGALLKPFTGTGSTIDIETVARLLRRNSVSASLTTYAFLTPEMYAAFTAEFNSADILTPAVAKSVNSFLLDLVDSMTNDTNYKGDLKQSLKAVRTYNSSTKKDSSKVTDSVKAGAADVSAEKSRSTMYSLVKYAMTSGLAGA